LVSVLALPIDALIPEIRAALASNPNLVVEAAPGAGKTTRIPPALLPDVSGKILVLEPRRLAARLAARRVAQERGEPLGETVGFQVRFEQSAGPRTRLYFLTEGVLTRRFLSDPTLDGVSLVILDEFHERHLDTDLALAYLLHLQRTRRKDLKLLVMSATLDAAPIAEHLGNAPVLTSQGRLFPLAVRYTPDSPDPLEDRVAKALESLAREGLDGHVLVFLPGAAEMRRASRTLAPLAERHRFVLAQLHGDLSSDEQDAALAPSDRPKVILSTNIAESSITIDGVTAVIDSGLARIAVDSPYTGIPSVEVARISQSSAIQRAGRAARTAPGRVIRLYPEAEFLRRPQADPPEITRRELSQLALDLHAAGIPDPSALPWLTPLPESNLAAAEALLSRLGAIGPAAPPPTLPLSSPTSNPHISPAPAAYAPQDAPPPVSASQGLAPRVARDTGTAAAEDDTPRTGAGPAPASSRQPGGDTSRLTPLGRRMGDLPLHPRLAKLVLEAIDRGAGEDGVIAAALLSAGDRLQGPPRHHGPCDLFLLMEQGLSPHTARIASQIRRAARPPKRNAADDTPLLLALTAAFSDRLGRRKANGEILLAQGGSAQLADSSGVRKGALLVALDIESRSDRGLPLVRLASHVEADWLLELFPERLDSLDTLDWNRSANRVEQLSAITFDGFAIDETRSHTPDPEAAARMLAQKALEAGIATFAGQEELDTLLARWRFAAQYGGPAAPEQEQLEEALAAACYGLKSFAELKPLLADGGLERILLGSLAPGDRDKLERLAPQRIQLPGGRHTKVSYADGQPPWVSSRLQDFFGMKETPAVAGGRVNVVVHLLAPNRRPVQMTQDLAGFWERLYPQIRKELSRRYPRHAWPEDPT
jgi:ATP-dependent helicase HrpB